MEKSAYLQILCGIIIAVMIGLVSFSVIVVAESGTEVALSPVQPENLSPELRDYLSPPDKEALEPFALTDISDEDFTAAEIAVSINYNLVGCNLTDRSSEAMLTKGQQLMAGLEISVGVERVAQGQGSTKNFGLQSWAGLQSVSSRRSARFWDASLQHRQVAQRVKAIDLEDQEVSRGAANSTVTTITSRVQELGFAKEDLFICTNELHWFIQIRDCNSKPLKIAGEEYERPAACLDSFNITVGNVRYSSLVHPCFAAGWTITAEIAGRSAEIFQKAESSSDNIPNTGLLDQGEHTDEHWIPTGTIRGVAGVIEVSYFDELDDLGQESIDDGNYIYDLLKDLGDWEIYLMIAENDSDDVDDDDMLWLLDDKVDDQMTVRYSQYYTHKTFWYISTHGISHWYYGNNIASSNTNMIPFYDDSLSEYQLCVQMDKITGDGFYLFYWMASCDSKEFDNLWTDDYWHHDKAVVWCYDTSLTNMNGASPQREMWCMYRHVHWGGYSVQAMFEDTTYPYTDGRYYYVPGAVYVEWIKDAYESATAYHIYQHSPMSFGWYF